PGARVTGGQQGPSRQRPAAGPAPAQGAAVPPRGQRGRFGRATGSGTAPRQAREEKQARPSGSQTQTRPEGDYAQLFVSVGRSRRVYARDLTDLFTAKLQLSSGDIGGVRVFEKYSFVDIVAGKAQEAITKLSGTEVKGRPITVNFAKKKEEKEGT
ncbi:MAG TPA: DbpA RNA binding domain-containing protein, partial [Spirochaetia bacterium]